MREGDNPRQSCSDQLDHGVGSSGLCEERVVVGAGGSSVKKGDISLRKWLDRPARKVDHLVCLHIFRQIVQIVNLAHSQGIVLHNVRPSCFLMSSFGRVSFIESSARSCSSFETYKDALKNRITEGQSSLSSPHELHKQRSILGHEGSTLEINPADAYEKASGTGSLWLSSPYATRLASIEKREERKVGDKEKAEEVHESKKNFPLNQLLLTEISWYTSPEEVVGSPSSFSSDIYRLGVLLFELFCTFSSIEEKLRTMSNLRHRILPPHLLLKCSKEASFCLWLLHPQPATRPKMIELIQSEFLNESRVDSEERESAIKRKEEIEEQELLVEFLLVMQQSKQEACDKLHNVISCLSSDIEEVMNQQLICKNKGVLYQELNHGGFSASENVDHPPLGLLIKEDSARLGSRKRFRPRLQINDENELYEDLEKFQVSKEHLDNHDMQSKSCRMMNNFAMLESAYFSTRCSLIKPMKALTNRCSRIGSNGKGSIVITEGSSVDNFGSKEGNCEDRRSGCINPFVEGLYKYLAFNKLKVRADLKHGDLLSSSNLVCSLSFDRDRELFASAGVNRKIKIFECDIILKQNHDIHYPVIEMVTRSKLSSICWNSYIKSQIASSDFDGVVQIWDVVQGQVFMEMNEHERRVWSVDYSLADPTKLVSGSDDGTVKLWNINQGGSIGTIKTKANVCCVQFPPDSARSIVVGSADHKIYCYDLRNTRTPLSTLIGHNKTVSYVKYVDSSTLVSASTDNSLKLWDLSTCTSQVLVNPLQTFTGHTNVKNFVGLSIYDGYIATGSETNEVFIYHKAFPTPILSFKFGCTDPLSGLEVDGAEQFVSSVCWRGQSSTLLAANSTGNIKILEMDLLEWFCYLGFEENILLDRVGVGDSRIQTEAEALALQGLKMAEDLNTNSL